MGTYGGYITLASVSDGSDGGNAAAYGITTTKEKSYKFYEGLDVTYSPGIITISAYKTENSVTTVLLTTEYDLAITVAGYPSFGNLFGLLNRLQGKYLNGELENYVNLLGVIRTVTSNSITFDFEKIIDYYVPIDETLNNTEADVTLLDSLKELIITDNISFILKTYAYNNTLEPLEDNLYATKSYPLEFGTSENMAKFIVASDSIQAAIDSSKLIFDADYGLSIYNGGIRILNSLGEVILGYNESNGLTIKGNGEFTGKIIATEGSFSGDISATSLTAQSGDIGGFIISDSGLFSKGGAQYINDEWDTSTSFLQLLGEFGLINAKNINLGIGAHITQYIQLGNAFLWNPDASGANGKIIEAGATSLTQTGILTLGNIEINGNTSTISGNSFEITPELSTFNNINATGKISTAIFENSHIQSVGGSLLFKPSYKIESYNGMIFTLDQSFLGAVNDYVYLIDSSGNKVSGLGQITTITDNVIEVIALTETWNVSTSFGIIDIGVSGSIFFGINANDSNIGYLRPRGLTISEFIVQDGIAQESSIPKVFLGDLNTLGLDGISGYGLFGQNVFLNGSLTTQSEDGHYAGIDTISGTNAIIFSQLTAQGIEGIIDDTSRIVYWAGAKSTSSLDIQSAPFQITQNGSIYAAQGVFSGALISNAEIRGVDIYAAKIHGTGETVGLSFYDVDNGIAFFHDTTERFRIGQNGLAVSSNYFISISDTSVNFKGASAEIFDIYTDITKTAFLHLKDNKIYSATTQGDSNSLLSLYPTYIQLQTNIVDYLKIEIGKTTLNSDETYIKNTVNFGEKMRYEKCASGYNLYIE